jgi:hypothetical protein
MVFVDQHSKLFDSRQFAVFCVLCDLLRLLICLANRAAKSYVVSIRVQHNKITHPVGLVGRLHFHDGAVLLYFLKILIDPRTSL